jgi:hypothetical protein
VLNDPTRNALEAAAGLCLSRAHYQLAPPASIAHLQKTNPQEWMRQFRAWAESHDRTTPAAVAFA